MSVFGGNSGPSQSEIVRRQEEAAKAESERIATEAAQKEATSQQRSQEAVEANLSKRRSLVSGIVDETEEQSRRRFLRAA